MIRSVDPFQWPQGRAGFASIPSGQITDRNRFRFDPSKDDYESIQRDYEPIQSDYGSIQSRFESIRRDLDRNDLDFDS